MTDIDYQRATSRLFLFTGAIGLGGIVFCLIAWGPSAALGFGLGSSASLLNLWVWQWLASSLERKAAEGKSGRKSALSAALFGARFLALFAAGYVIIVYLNVPALAAIAGLFASAAAVLMEILAELVAQHRLSQ